MFISGCFLYLRCTFDFTLITSNYSQLFHAISQTVNMFQNFDKAKNFLFKLENVGLKQ
jgi:hypothetical protein